MLIECLFNVKMIKLIKKILRKFFKTQGQTLYINGSEVLKAPLSSEDEEKYVKEFTNGSKDARDILIEHNLRLVVYVAKRYETNITNLEDLISIGTLGLIKAINTFKLDKNIKLATYASRCIENEILMFLRKKVRMKNEISLDEPLKCDYDGNELLLSDILSENEFKIIEDINYSEKTKELEEAISELKDREKEILTMRFGLFNQEEKTQKETAEILGISQSYISRLEKRILKKLEMSLKK